MNKFLRYSFVALLMMLFNGVSAKEVVILPSDFTPVEATDYTTLKDGVMVSVSASTVTDSQMRIFKNQSITIVSMSGNITKVVISCMAEGTEKYGPGCFGAVDGYTYEGKEGTWTGNSSYLVLTAETAQVRATKIVVTLGEGGEEGDDPDDDGNPLSMFEYKSGTITESAEGNQVIVDYVAVNADAEITGKIIFDFENSLCTKSTMTANFPTAAMAQEFYQWLLDNKEKEGVETLTIDGVTVTVTMTDDFYGLSKIVVKSMMKMMIDDEETGYGSLNSPLSPNMANIVAGTLPSGEVSEEYYIKGKIAAITYPFSAQYGTATFFISLDGQNDFTFQCYSVYYLENKPWVDGNTQIQVGDEVVICGKLTNFKGTTPETVSKQAYIYSLNGVTKNESGDPDVVEATCAEILAGTDGTVYRATGKCTEIVNTTYGNWYLEDATGKVYIYGTLDAEGKAKNFASLGIEVGDEITVEGPKKTYNETVELVNVKVIAINKGDSGISTIKTNSLKNDMIHNLAGQKVGKDYKGLVIMNGRKYIQK